MTIFLMEEITESHIEQLVVECHEMSTGAGIHPFCSVSGMPMQRQHGLIRVGGFSVCLKRDKSIA